MSDDASSQSPGSEGERPASSYWSRLPPPVPPMPTTPPASPEAGQPARATAEGPPPPPSPTEPPAGWPAAEWPVPAPPSPLAGPGARRRLLAALAAGVAAVVVLSAVLVVALGGQKSAEAMVVDSVQSTLSDRTAHVDISLDATSAAVSLTGTGAGDMDFSQNAAQLHLDTSAAGQQVSVDEILVGGTMYMGGQFGGQSLSQLVPGKSWISIDLSSLASALGQSSASLGGGTTPAAMLRLLAQRGNTVVPLGSSTIDGTAVQGYQVTFDPAKVRSELASPNLPSWFRQAVSQVDFGHLVTKVYVDGSDTLRRMVDDMQISAAGTTMQMDVTSDFSDFGEAVHVSAPPADQVVSFQQLLAQLGSSSLGG